MKVIEDKVTACPPHAIRKADVPIILSALPAEWTAGIRSVRLSSSHGENPTVIAFFFPPDGTLMIKSRGFSTERVLRALLTELAGHALGVVFRTYRRLQKRDESRIERVVAPLMDQIMPVIAPIKRPQGHHSWSGLRPFPLTKENTEPNGLSQ
jgi:hypothetical protein